jgi:hypothetical protein
MVSLSRRGLLRGLAAALAVAALPVAGVRAAVKWWRREQITTFGAARATVWHVPAQVEAAERELLAKLLRDGL